MDVLDLPELRSMSPLEEAMECTCTHAFCACSCGIPVPRWKSAEVHSGSLSFRERKSIWVVPCQTGDLENKHTTGTMDSPGPTIANKQLQCASTQGKPPFELDNTKLWLRSIVWMHKTCQRNQWSILEDKNSTTGTPVLPGRKTGTTRNVQKKKEQCLWFCRWVQLGLSVGQARMSWVHPTGRAVW